MRWIVFWAMFIAFIPSGYAAEIRIPEKIGNPGNNVEIPVVIDETDNLAGIKMVLTYDTKVLEYISLSKTEHTASLMHIVNDKKPGVLVVVMAGARGIKGKNMTLLTITFKVKNDVKPPVETTTKFTEIQLMSDQLKEIQAKTSIAPLKLVKAAESAPPEDGKTKR